MVNILSISSFPTCVLFKFFDVVTNKCFSFSLQIPVRSDESPLSFKFDYGMDSVMIAMPLCAS